MAKQSHAKHIAGENIDSPEYLHDHLLRCFHQREAALSQR